MFKVGDRIVYPQHGAGVIDGIEKRTVLGEEVEYLTIRIIADDLVTCLMGDLVEPRKEFIERHAPEVQNLDI